MSGVKTYARDEFSDFLGLSDRREIDGDSDRLAPWGIARLIRREIRRKSIATRRELRQAIEPYLMAISFKGDVKGVIQTVADRMVEVGELVDLKVENQRGYSAMPSRWIALDAEEAVLLGTIATKADSFYPPHANQFLRRFRPSDEIVAELNRIGVSEQSLDEWLGQAGWMTFVDPSQSIESLDGLLDWHINRLETEGSPLRLESTSILAVDHRPGEFFGSERNPLNSRWTPCNQLDEGLYIGTQPGQNENHWIPLLVRIQGDANRAIELHHRNDATSNNDLRNWLLMAIGARRQRKEVITIDQESREVQCTFPMPTAIRRILQLLGEPTGSWQRYTVRNPEAAGHLLRKSIPEVCVL